MRYLVLTDIHANLEALDTCLADARGRTFDATLVLGERASPGDRQSTDGDHSRRKDGKIASRNPENMHREEQCHRPRRISGDDQEGYCGEHRRQENENHHDRP